MIAAEAEVAVAAFPVVFWFQVGTVPVNPEYGAVEAKEALVANEEVPVRLPWNEAVTEFNTAFEPLTIIFFQLGIYFSLRLDTGLCLPTSLTGLQRL